MLIPARHALLVIALGSAVSAGCAERPESPETAAAAPAARRVPVSEAGLKDSFAPVVQRTAPAVVNIAAQSSQPQDRFFDLYGERSPRVARAQGSGVLISADGVIVTNNHVVEGAQNILVGLNDRREFPARILLTDPRTDLAVLKIDPGSERLPFLNVDVEEQAQVGDLVLAIGNPFGVGQTVTSGIVSAIDRTGTGLTDVGSFIQTDAAINPGNSGGALVDMDGDLIGINTAILSQSGASSGVGFAIPATLVRQVADSAGEGRRQVVRPYLGVAAVSVDANIAERLRLPRPEGVLVAEVAPGSPAARGGLQQGDVITAVDGGAVGDASALNFRIATARAGEPVTLDVRRDGSARQVRVTVEPPPG